MGLRDIALVAFILGSLPVCFLRPYVGLLIYYWIGFFNPHRYSWEAASFPVAFLVAGATLAGMVLNKDRNRIPLQREMVLLLLLWLAFTFSTPLAFYPDLAWGQWKQVSKIILMSVVTVMLITNRQRLRYLMLLTVASIGFFGVKGGIFTLVTGGESIVYGPPGGFYEANNALGLALAMVMPLAWYAAKAEESFWLRTTLRVIFLLSIVAAIFTYSRGAFLAVGIVLMMITLKSRHRMLAGFLLVAGGLMFLAMSPESILDRQRTLLNVEEDGSAQSRLMEWRFATNVALDRPLSGGGFRMYSQQTYDRYLPEFGKWWDAHSVYFAVLGEHGFVALFIFLALLASLLLSLWRMRRFFRRRADPLCHYCDAVQVSLIAYMIAGAFLDAAYFDILYELIAMVVVLSVLAQRTATAAVRETVIKNKDEFVLEETIWEIPARSA